MGIYGQKWITVLFHGVEYKELLFIPVIFTVYSSNFYINVIFTVSAAKITVYIVKCTGTHRNFSSATMNYPNAIFTCEFFKPFLTYFDTEKYRAVEENDFFQRKRGLALKGLSRRTPMKVIEGRLNILSLALT